MRRATMSTPQPKQIRARTLNLLVATDSARASKQTPEFGSKLPAVHCQRPFLRHQVNGALRRRIDELLLAREFLQALGTDQLRFFHLECGALGDQPLVFLL